MKNLHRILIIVFILLSIGYLFSAFLLTMQNKTQVKKITHLEKTKATIETHNHKLKNDVAKANKEKARLNSELDKQLRVARTLKAELSAEKDQKAKVEADLKKEVYKKNFLIEKVKEFTEERKELTAKIEQLESIQQEMEDMVVARSGRKKRGVAIELGKEIPLEAITIQSKKIDGNVLSVNNGGFIAIDLGAIAESKGKTSFKVLRNGKEVFSRN